MTSFTGYWLTRGRPHCLGRWLSSSFSPLAGRAVSPVLLVAGLEHVMRQQPYSIEPAPHGFTGRRALQCSPRHLARLGISATQAPKKTIWGLGNPIEGQQLGHDDLSHAPHLRLVSMPLVD